MWFVFIVIYDYCDFALFWFCWFICAVWLLLHSFLEREDKGCLKLDVLGPDGRNILDVAVQEMDCLEN